MRYFYEEWAGGTGIEPSAAVALAAAWQRLRRMDRATAEELIAPWAGLPEGPHPFDHSAYIDAFHCHGWW